MLYLRQIVVNIDKPPIHAFTLTCEEDETYPIKVKYEKLGNFCYYCNKITHKEWECSKKYEARKKNIPMEEIQHLNRMASYLRKESPRRQSYGDGFLKLPHQTFRSVEHELSGANRSTVGDDHVSSQLGQFPSSSN